LPIETAAGEPEIKRFLDRRLNASLTLVIVALILLSGVMVPAIFFLPYFFAVKTAVNFSYFCILEKLPYFNRILASEESKLGSTLYSPTSSRGEPDQPIPIDNVETFNQDLWADEPITESDPQPESEIELTDIRHQEPTLDELLEEIDLDTLQLRPARKICGRLGIQQKVNSKDAPLSWLRSQIKSRLSEKPSEVAPIIQEILEAA
jgi:hypothetical protein